MMKVWLADASPRARIMLAIFFVALIAAPLVVNPYVLSVLILVLSVAYFGQAWNIMMGFAGQLSLGHALYFGLGAYTSAALFMKFGISPWFGMVVGGLVAAAAGAFIGALGFRFRIGGVYFALLTIAFAEFSRILMDHLTWTGGSAGYFIKVENRNVTDLWTLRGPPMMFYYIWLTFAAGVLILCRALLASRLGYFWLAIREDQEAAEALGINTFRYKMYAVILSSALTSFGGVIYAFYNNNLFPSSIFAISRSIDMLLGTTIGGVGTLFGPIVGAFLLTPLGEFLTVIIEPFKGGNLRLAGIKQVFYGLCVIAIVVFQPRGLWPYLSAKLGVDRGEEAK
ncbi:MAG: branched-chain amino acid ABC transporter permease [Pseudolabrys sp.]|nr:branched-chain amino acid ABC transporter permease [Pseudolabrys sp.]